MRVRAVNDSWRKANSRRYVYIVERDGAICVCEVRTGFGLGSGAETHDDGGLTKGRS